MAGLLELMQERQQRLAAARPNSIAGLLGQVGTYPGENLASIARQQIASIPQKFEENQRYQMGLLEKAYPGSTYESMMTQGDPKALAELAMQVPLNAMVAYHGTPHNIAGKFDISKVGTGEGAQAYGHGMYFAENPSVAEGYQTALSKKSPEAVKYMNELSQDSNIASQVAATTLQNFDNSKQAIDQLKANLKNKNTPKEYIPIYESAIKKLENTPVSGNLYKVDIPDKDIPNMLDWDKPLNQQSDVVKQALGLPEDKFAGFKVPATGTNYSFSQNWRGEDLYKALTDLSKTQAGASEILNSMGIKGIRYKDAISRKADEGTSNFVVFDPSTVKILEKNSQKVEGLLD